MDKLFGEVPTFEWEELDGKTLVIKVVSVEGYAYMYGKDVLTGKLYVVAERKNKF